jgi:hypothetical protein
MKPLSRSHVNKSGSAKHFRHQVGHTHPKNVIPMPMRGGIRL